VQYYFYLSPHGGSASAVIASSIEQARKSGTLLSRIVWFLKVLFLHILTPAAQSLSKLIYDFLFPYLSMFQAPHCSTPISICDLGCLHQTILVEVI
jgi:hypothetical protein